MSQWLVFTLAIALLAPAAQAATITNSARPITHRVTVQLIQTALDDGTSPASVFGNSTQRADIEAGIDTIWAQAGIDVHFLPTIIRYNDTFAYRGNNGSNPRSVNDLPTLYNNARNEGGILHSDNSVLNMFFVDVVPGFVPMGESNAAGVAAIAANGAAAFTGSNLIASISGRDTISAVIAHEIGHNLGLSHSSSTANLMSSGMTTAQLTTSQINVALTKTRFVKLLPAELTGDYNGDNVVNAADYVVWRKLQGRQGTNLPADGNDDSQVDAGDYTTWRTNFGKAAANVSSGVGCDLVSVPEPTSLLLLVVAASAVLIDRRSRSQLPPRPRRKSAISSFFPYSAQPSGVAL